MTAISRIKTMKYIVESENLLGYVIGETNKITGYVGMVVMAVDVEKGGEPTMIDREVLATDYRAATKADFERFGIVPPNDLDMKEEEVVDVCGGVVAESLEDAMKSNGKKS